MQQAQTTEMGIETRTTLKLLATKHDVCYEVWPCTVLVNGRQVKVGFELDLCGVNENGGCHLSPGCPLCVATFGDLRRIAHAILPPQAGSVRCEVQPYDATLHGSPKRRLRPEVILAIDILHRDEFDQPADGLEADCLKQMCRKLQELGVWSA